MALNTLKCNHLMPLHFKGLRSALLLREGRVGKGKVYRLSVIIYLFDV